MLYLADREVPGDVPLVAVAVFSARRGKLKAQPDVLVVARGYLDVDSLRKGTGVEVTNKLWSP